MEPIFAIASPYPDTLLALTTLWDRGFRLGVISNTPWGSPAELWREELARHGVLPLCEHVLFCRDVGWRKPARPIFQKALDVFGCRPEDCVFVGDNVTWDVYGALRVGITPVLIARSGQTRSVTVPQIASLCELGALLMEL
jgi:FMN phosphatase YigB (HAD superfamily)